MYRYKQIISGRKGVVLEHENPNELVTLVLQLREKRGLPKANHGDTYNDVQDSFRVQSKRFKKRKKKDQPKLSWRDAFAAGRAALKNITRDTVSKEEMTRRLSICARCPLFKDLVDCRSGG